MKLAYISPSVLPSRSANSIHVTQQCDALAKEGARVTLFAKRESRDTGGLRAAVKAAYGVDFGGVELRTVYTPFERANNFVIAAHALLHVLFSRFDAVLSRNLFASFFLAVFSRVPLIIEVHQVEQGFRGRLQRIACRRPRVIVVTISERLRADMQAAIGADRRVDIRVFHDAAPDSLGPITEVEREAWRREYLDYPADEGRFICAYVGHLYPGRGIEIIESLARGLPEVLFLVIGGTERDIADKRAGNTSPNLRFLGHVPHPVARAAMNSADVLLMPYQVKVSIGLAGSDTARWMSPMKMFEYMASGTAFVASDIEVLREVLNDGENVLLVPPAEIDAWRAAIVKLRGDMALREALARRAYDDYQTHYTWRRRAERILACFGK